jgi:hypothetical protein
MVGDVLPQSTFGIFMQVEWGFVIRHDSSSEILTI